jgi:hypothetical protein
MFKNGWKAAFSELIRAHKSWKHFFAPVELLTSCPASSTMVDLVADGLKRRDTTADDRRTIFFACRTAMAKGSLKKGFISELAKQLRFHRPENSFQAMAHKMACKLAPLRNNQDEENHPKIINENAHILFGTEHSSRRKGKFKYCRDELKTTIEAVRLKERMNICNLASIIGIPKSTIHSFIKPPKPKR